MILVAGDIMLDVLLLPELREEEQGGGLLVRGGGSAANTAAWLAHGGDDVVFVGCVGDDPAGEMLREELRRTGVRTAIRTVHADTGSVAVEITPEVDRIMRSSRGANQMLRADDLVRAAASEQVDAIHLTGYALLGSTGLDLLQTASGIARNTGALLSFDPSSLGVIRRFGPDALLHALVRASVHLFLPNLGEAEELTGECDPATMALKLALPFERVAVKAGADGATAAQHHQAAHVRANRLVPVDTTGGGDAFNAGVLHGLAMGISFFETVDEANRLAGICVGRYGARPPTPKPANPPQ